jgi:hypothetical protein
VAGIANSLIERDQKNLSAAVDSTDLICQTRDMTSTSHRSDAAGTAAAEVQPTW